MKRLLFALLFAASSAQAAGVFVSFGSNASPPNGGQLASGTIWAPTSIGVSAGTILGVAYGAGTWCAITSTSSFYSLDNGLTWTAGGSFTGPDNVIVYGGAGLFTIWGSDIDHNATSTDCKTWAVGGTASGSQNPTGMVWDSVNMKFIMLAGNTDTWTSSNGSVWAHNIGNLPQNFSYMASCGGTTLAIFPSFSTLARSTTGGVSTWTSLIGALPITSAFAIACSDSAHFVVIGSTVVNLPIVAYTSDSGTTWSVGIGLGTLAVSSIAWDGTRYAAIAPGMTSFAASTDDGQTWTVTTGAIPLTNPALVASPAGAIPTGGPGSCLLGGGIFCELDLSAFPLLASIR